LKYKMKKCPICNSSKINENEEGEKHCEKCGYTHSNKKQIEKIKDFE